MGPTRPQGAHRQHRPLALPARPTPLPEGRCRVLLLALAVLVPVTVAACGGRPADEVTTLRTAGPGSVVVTATGLTQPAVDGERLAVGESVRTSGADAALLTGGRVTTLGPGTEVAIAGRSQYLLDSGTLVLDHRTGPGATVVAGPVSVGDVGRTSVRIERGFGVRVAVYDGGGARVAAGGQSLTVLALHELDVPGAALPVTAPPLSLRDDALDVLAAPALVSLDRALDRRAAQVDEPAGVGAAGRFAQRTATVVPASDVRTGPLSDRVLPAAMAGAVHGDASRTYAVASALRAAGGSWGVVAELVGAPLSGIEQEVSLLLGPEAAGAPLSGVLFGTGPISGLDELAAALPAGILDGLTGVAGGTGAGTAGPGTAGGAAGSGTTGGTGTGAGTGDGTGGGGTGTGSGSGTGAGGSGGSGGTPVASASVPDTGASATPQPSTVDAGGGGATAAPTPSVPAAAPTPTPTTLVGGLLGTVLGLVAPSASVPPVVVLPTAIPLPRL